MIGIATRGNGFRGCLNYLFSESDWAGNTRPSNPRLIGGNMLGCTPKQLASEFAVSRQLADSRVKNPVYHVSLSLAPGEELSDEQWQEAATLFIKKMGERAIARGDRGIDPEKNQWCLIRHPAPPSSGKLDHVHLVLSRTDLEGSTSKLRNDHYDLQEVCRELEQIFGLSTVETSEKTKRLQKRRREQRRQGAILLEAGEEIPPELQEETRLASREDIGHWARLRRKGKKSPPNVQSRAKAFVEKHCGASLSEVEHRLAKAKTRQAKQGYGR